MSEFYMGVYWHNRSTTLRQHADETKEFLRLLQSLHPIFNSLEWVGNESNSAKKLSSDLSNLDDLIYRHAGRSSHVYCPCATDGSPVWESSSEDGFGMWYDTGRATSAGGFSISIYTGKNGPRIPNAVTISFPKPNDARFPHREFWQYAFLKRLFQQMVCFWKPEDGLVTSYAFSSAITGGGAPGVGWLTYVCNPRAAAIRNDIAFKNFIMENAPHGGVLFSLGTTLPSPENLQQVEQAR